MSEQDQGFTKDEIAEFERAHEDVAHICHGGGRYGFLLRPPQPAEYKRFRGSVHEEDAREGAQQQMVETICVAAWFKDKAGAVDKALDVPGARRVMARILTRFAGVCDQPAVTKALKQLFGDAVAADAK